jgi:hypothetical protein
MNRRPLLLVLILVLGAVAWWLSDRSEPTTLDRPLSDFAIADTSSVTRIFITDQHGATVDLKRTGNGWTLNEVFMAKPSDVSLLLKTFKRVTVKSPVPKASEAMTLRVMGSSAKKVEIYEGGDAPSKIWIVGHGTKDHFGTYMLLEKPGLGRSSAPFIMGMTGFTGILGTRFHTKLDDWRSTELLDMDDIRQVAMVEMEMPFAPASSYRIEQFPDGRVSLTTIDDRPFPFDTVLVKGAILPLKKINFEAIERSLSASGRDSLVNSTPNHIVRIAQQDGHVDALKFWYMPYTGEEPPFGSPRPLYDDLRMHALVQDTLLVVMQRPAWARILQPISGFRP